MIYKLSVLQNIYTITLHVLVHIDYVIYSSYNKYLTYITRVEIWGKQPGKLICITIWNSAVDS